MARIKIKELPFISYDDIKDTDIMVVENKKDTFQSSIADMKKVFSCDSKIAALTENINKQLTELADIINTNNETIYKNINDLTDKMGVIERNVDTITKKLATAENNIANHKDKIETLESDTKIIKEILDENDRRNEQQNSNLESLNKDNETNKSNIKDLQDLTDRHDKHLGDIDQELEYHKNLINQNKEETDQTIQDNYEYLNNRIQSKYMELLSIIDFYHHLTHDNEGNVVLDDGETQIVINVNG